MTTATLLLIENDIENSRAIKRSLETSDYEVLEARNAEEALQVILSKGPENTPNLIVCDLLLPGTNGIETINFLKAHLPDVPIIGLWNTFDFTLSNAVTDLGVQKILSKPVDEALLAKTIRGILSPPPAQPA